MLKKQSRRRGIVASSPNEDPFKWRSNNNNKKNNIRICKANLKRIVFKVDIGRSLPKRKKKKIRFRARKYCVYKNGMCVLSTHKYIHCFFLFCFVVFIFCSQRVQKKLSNELCTFFLHFLTFNHVHWQSGMMMMMMVVLVFACLIYTM